MQAGGRLVARVSEQHVDRDVAVGIEMNGGDAALLMGDLDDPAFDDRDAAASKIGPDLGRHVVPVGEDGQLVGPVLEEPRRLVGLRAGPEQAPMLAGNLETIAVGTGHDRRAPAVREARNARHLIGHAITQDHAACPTAFAIPGEDREIVDGAGDAVRPRIDHLDRRVTRQLPPRLGQDVQRRLVIVAEQAMRMAGEAITRQTGVQDSDLAAGAAELQGGGEAGKAAADDDDVIHGEGSVLQGEYASLRQLLDFQVQ